MIDNAVVQANASYTRQTASASGMNYRIIKGTGTEITCFGGCYREIR